MTLINRLLSLCVTALILTMVGCAMPRPYYMEIRQGNFMDNATIKQLRVGQTKHEVRELLGPPTIVPLFHANQWEYYYRLRPNTKNQIIEKRLTIYFNDGRVERFNATGVN